MAVSSAVSYEAVYAVTHFPTRAIGLVIAGGIRVAGGTNICPNYNICRHKGKKWQKEQRAKLF